MSEWMDTQEFYELMQAYRTAPLVPQRDVVARYEAVQEFIGEKLDADLSNWRSYAQQLEARCDQRDLEVAELRERVAHWKSVADAFEDELSKTETLAINLRHDAYIGRRAARNLWSLMAPHQQSQARQTFILPRWLSIENDDWKDLP